VCYWPGKGKEGQFPPGFGKREDVRGITVGTRQGSLYQTSTANVAQVENNNKQTFAFMTIGDSNIKVQPPLPPEIAINSDSCQSYSCNKNTNQNQRLKRVQVGSNQTSRDSVSFTENRHTLIDSGVNDHCFTDISMFSSYTPFKNPSEGLSTGKGSVFSIIGKENVKF